MSLSGYTSRDVCNILNVADNEKIVLKVSIKCLKGRAG